MKTAIISALLLTGCAVQPPYQVAPAPQGQAQAASYSRPVSRYNDCVEALATVLAYSQVGSDVLDKCFAGNGTQCDAFILFRDGMNGKLRTAEGIACVNDGTLGPFHPLVVGVSRETPLFVKKIKRFDAMKRR